MTSREGFPAPAAIAIEMLGRFTVSRDGEPIPDATWGRHKTLALLKILLLNRGRVLSKDELIEALYDGGDPQKKVRNLQGRVSELRRALEPNLASGANSQYVLRIAEGYCFSDDVSCWLDTEVFLQRIEEAEHSQEEHRWNLAAESYESAAALYRGDLLETDRYEEWVEPSRGTLRRTYISSMLELATCYQQLGRLRQSISCCQQILAKEPHHEAAITRLMEYQAQAGHRDAALETYREGRRILREYLDVEPSAELEALKEELVSPATHGAMDFDPRRIAVLPLQNFSLDPADEYLADGMTEELVGSLARVRDFRVIARTSVMRFKNSNQSIPQIARILNVGSIVEGSVRKAGNQFRVAAQLIDVRTEEHIWAKEYDGHVSEILSMQRTIAREVANALQIQLMSDEQQALSPQRITEADAHMLFLQGRYLLWQGNAHASRNGMAYLEKATALDPSNAVAFAALASAYALGSELEIPIEEAHRKARAAVSRALEIDQTLAEAHSALGLIQAHIEHDAVAGKDSLDAALRLNPSLAIAHTWQGLRQFKLGQHARAVDSHRTAISLDPGSPYHYWSMARALVKLNRIDEGLASLDRALQINPTHVGSMIWRVGIYHLLRQWERAESCLAELLDAHPQLPRVGQLEAEHLLFLGELDQSRVVFERACEREIVGAAHTHWHRLSLAHCLNCSRMYEEAIYNLMQILDANPSGVGTLRRFIPLFHISIAYEQLSEYVKALSLLDEASEVLFAEKTGERKWVPGGQNEMPIWIPTAIGMVNQASGNKPAAQAALAGLRTCPTNRPGQSARAVLCFRMGLLDEGFEALDLAIENHDWFILTIKTHPWFDPVRGDPRFISALERMNLAD